jgi:hypothetical protein
VGQSKGATETDSDLTAGGDDDNSAELTSASQGGGGAAGAASRANPKAAFVQAKTKVLKHLSTQHLISHTLPVVISLKHCLEAIKSPLQVTPVYSVVLNEFFAYFSKNYQI